MPHVEEERTKLKDLHGVALGVDLKDRIIGVYYLMKEEDVKRAKLILAGIKSFICQIFMKRGELHKLEEEKR